MSIDKDAALLAAVRVSHDASHYGYVWRVTDDNLARAAAYVALAKAVKVLKHYFDTSGRDFDPREADKLEDAVREALAAVEGT